MTASPKALPNPHLGMSFRQFVTLIAAMMATNALAVDAMLPALPVIGDSLGIAAPNDRQWIITSYLLGFGCAQLFYGTFADRFGRRPVLFVGFALYVAASLAAAASPSVWAMMTARVAQGIGAAATRVLAVSIVRDCYAGRQMARVMSLAFIVFLAAPIVAPSLGQVILWFAPWRWIFGALAVFGISVGLWAATKLPETLRAEDRRPIAFASVRDALGTILGNRTSMGYMLAMTLVMGSLFGFINSAQQVFVDVLHAGSAFTLIFAVIAIFMAFASLLNARIVGRVGSRRVSHAALLAFIAVTSTHAVVAWTGHETVVVFATLQALSMFAFGLLGPNFSAIAMEPLGHVAGTASSVQGFITTVGGALLGFAIGQRLDGTVVPLTLGFAASGIGALGLVLFAERGRLFHPQQRPL